jgi:PST family polysaccharide transporter
VTEPELEPSALSDTVVRGVGFAGAGFVAGQAITLGFYLALSRLAEPSDFGEFAAGALLVNAGLVFSESGMLAALIHREERIDEAASTAVAATFVGGLLLSLIALAASPLIGHFFHSDRIGEIAAAMSGVLLLRSMMVVPEALLQRRFSFLRRVVIEPVGAIALGIAAVIACANGLGAWGLVIGFYAAATVDLLLSWILVQWRPRLREVSFSVWRELVGYGRHIIAVNSIERLSGEVPTLLIGRFIGTGALGQYRYGDRMASTPGALIVQAGSYVLFPAFARITEDASRFRAAALRSLGLMCALAFPLGLLLIPLGVPAAVLLFGEPWRDAGLVAMAMALVPVAGTPISFASETLKAIGRPDVLTRIHLLISLASVAAMLVLLPFGLVGVTAGLSVGMTVAAVFALFRAGRLLEFSLQDVLGAIGGPAIAGLLMVAVMVPVEFLLIDAAGQPLVKGLLLLAAEALTGLLIYFLALRTLAPETARELGSLALRLRRGSRK